MRLRHRTVQFAAALVFLAGAIVTMTGCPKHEDFPQPLAVSPVPTPDSLIVTRVDPQSTDYDFNWYVTDPGGVVSYVRIYLLGEGFIPDELIAETTDNPFQATFPSAVTGFRFAVSVVSTDNVEGSRRISEPAE